MPLDGCVRDMRYVPGRLFGVNPRCVRAIPRLFSRNERLVTLFDTAVGPMALIMVGAFIVGGIETRWAGTICPPHRRAPHRQPVAERDIDAAYHARGEEMGRFAIGSSVILLFGPGALEWPDTLAAGRSLRLGTPIGRSAPAPERAGQTTAGASAQRGALARDVSTVLGWPDTRRQRRAQANGTRRCRRDRA